MNVPVPRDRFGFEVQQPSTTGVPLNVFSPGWQPDISVHDALTHGMESWYTKALRQIEENVKKHVKTSVALEELMKTMKLTEDECAAVCYYTADARKYNGPAEKSPYRVLNSVLASRNQGDLEVWKPFLFYLLSALAKLPNYSGTVYRAIDKPLLSLSKQYKTGSNVVWPSFTSTSKNRDIMSNFSGKSEGTWMSIDVVEGKDISTFSLFPDESEILLLPNSTCHVSGILDDKMKNLIGIQSGIDALTITQNPTPKNLRIFEEISRNFASLNSVTISVEEYNQLINKISDLEKVKNIPNFCEVFFLILDRKN